MNENNDGKVTQAVQSQTKQVKQTTNEKRAKCIMLLYFRFAWAVYKDAVIMQIIFS